MTVDSATGLWVSCFPYRGEGAVRFEPDCVDTSVRAASTGEVFQRFDDIRWTGQLSWPVQPAPE